MGTAESTGSWACVRKLEESNGPKGSSRRLPALAREPLLLGVHSRKLLSSHLKYLLVSSPPLALPSGTILCFKGNFVDHNCQHLLTT